MSSLERCPSFLKIHWYLYSTDQMQGIRQMRLSPCISLPPRANAHEPYTSNLICTVYTYIHVCICIHGHCQRSLITMATVTTMIIIIIFIFIFIIKDREVVCQFHCVKLQTFTLVSGREHNVWREGGRPATILSTEMASSK